nr:hypothetical protein [Tamlana nanhaiensis]
MVSWLLRNNRLPKNILDFKVTSTTNHPILWHKNSKNEWVVANDQNNSFKITYRYFVDKKSVAESINTERAFFNA